MKESHSQFSSFCSSFFSSSSIRLKSVGAVQRGHWNHCTWRLASDDRPVVPLISPLMRFAIIWHVCVCVCEWWISDPKTDSSDILQSANNWMLIAIGQALRSSSSSSSFSLPMEIERVAIRVQSVFIAISPRNRMLIARSQAWRYRHYLQYFCQLSATALCVHEDPTTLLLL